MAVWDALQKFALYNLHSNPRRLSAPPLQVKKQVQKGSDLPKAIQMGRCLVFLSLSQVTLGLAGFFPVTHILLGEVKKSQVHFPSGEVGDSARFLLVQVAHLGPGLGNTLLYHPVSLGCSPLLSNHQRPWLRKLGFETRPPTFKSKGWQGRLSRRQGWPPPPPLCVYLLNFYCELIFKGENIP